MSGKNSGKKKISALYARSRILSLFVAVASYLYNKAECSLAGKLLTSYDENAAENSFICRFISRLRLGKRFFRPLKRTVSRLVSKSCLLEAVSGYLRGWLYTKLNVYGLFAITAGIGFLLVQLFKVYGVGAGVLSVLDVFASVLLIILSLPLMLSGSALNEAISSSKTARTLLFDCLGCRREAFEQNNAGGGHSRTALPAGVFLCVLSWWVRPFELLLGIVVFVFCLTVFFIPETGIVGILFLLPFVSSEKLKAVIIFTLICFAVKYIRGKRTVKFDPLTSAVAVYALLCAVCGYMSEGAFYSLCAFFVSVNLIKSKEWIRRCTGALSVSLFLTALFGLARYISAVTDFGYFAHLFRCAESETMTALFDTPSAFAVYIITVMPVAAVASGRKRVGPTAVLALFAGGVCLFLTYDYRAWISLLGGLILFMLLYGRRSLAAIGGIVLTLTFVLINIPQSVREKMSYRNITDYFSSELHGDIGGFTKGVAVLLPLLFMLVLFLGVQKNLTLYSKGCSREGKKISLAAMASSTAFLLTGANAAFFYDVKISLLFWLSMALSFSVAGTERNLYLESSPDEYI